MYGTNRWIRRSSPEKYFLATIHLDPLTDDRNAEGLSRLPSVTQGLIALMNSLRFPTTWAVSDPAFSAARPQVLCSAVTHELAISGDPSWVGPTAGRTRFARELARRVSQARHAGINVSSFVPRVASVQRHIDLVVKQQITAVAGVTIDSKCHLQAASPRMLHYGVCEFPTNAHFPPKTAWFFNGAWAVWRCVSLVVRHATTFHLVIDAPTVAKRGHRAEKAIALLMERIAGLSDRGLVVPVTLRTAAALLTEVPLRSPQRSILRPAA